MQDGRPFRKVPNPPTARELLDEIASRGVVCAHRLAARVEKVLALHEPPSEATDWDQGWLACLETVLRILNGEEVLTVLEEHGTAGCPGCAECDTGEEKS